MHPVRASLAARAASGAALRRENQSDLPIVELDGVKVEGGQMRKCCGQEAGETQRKAPSDCNARTELLLLLLYHHTWSYAPPYLDLIQEVGSSMLENRPPRYQRSRMVIQLSGKRLLHRTFSQKERDALLDSVLKRHAIRSNQTHASDVSSLIALNEATEVAARRLVSWTPAQVGPWPIPLATTATTSGAPMYAPCAVLLLPQLAGTKAHAFARSRERHGVEPTTRQGTLLEHLD
jgi:hypothetical protein